MNTAKKGRANENEAATIYTKAGYKVSATGHAWYGQQDFFGEFDLMAVHPERKVRLVQVKSNSASGITKFAERVPRIINPDHVVAEYAVRYDGHGGPYPTPPRWRTVQPDWEGDYHDVVDEREEGVPAEGEGLLEHLKSLYEGQKHALG